MTATSRKYTNIFIQRVRDSLSSDLNTLVEIFKDGKYWKKYI